MLQCTHLLSLLVVVGTGGEHRVAIVELLPHSLIVVKLLVHGVLEVESRVPLWQTYIGVLYPVEIGLLKH